MEIIVVDDGSTDETAAVVESFGSPVRLIRQRNGGPGAARNTGFAASRGEFIHFFDSDDLAAPNKQEVQAAVLEATGADIAYGPWLKGRFTEDRFIPEGQVLQQHGLPRGDLVKALLTTWSIVPHAALFRRNLVEKIGGFDPALFGVEDQKMFLECLLAGARVVHSPGTLELYRLGTVNKITESGPWVLRHKSDWAKFLMQARFKLQARGVEPLDWLGYRARLWKAGSELAALSDQPEENLIKITEMLGGPGRDLFYKAWLKIERWRGGLEERISGRRGHASFRIGAITKSQLDLVHTMGYRL
jgi:glycosyltransferase involved in cell wall biosynthesis